MSDELSVDIEQLISDIKACNEQLYQQEDQDLQWQLPLELIEKRALFLQKLSSIIPSLNPQQIITVGQFYESLLEADQHYLGLVRSEQQITRDSLRAIKNAEKALPAYKAHQ
ncbi:MAG: hypothetical protein ACI9FJ_000801 [Alteromonadaceae bacterium]|jgi:hypothetical protein